MKLIDIYEQHYLPEKTQKRAASTIAGYDSSMRLHVLPRWGECEIEDICPDDLQEWVDSFEKLAQERKRLNVFAKLSVGGFARSVYILSIQPHT